MEINTNPDIHLDILVIAAHPDDAELGCGGTIIKHIKEGYSVGIIDLTIGEMGTRGTPEIRIQEANEAAQIMGLTLRHNMKFKDTQVANDEESRLKIIQQIRKFTPTIILTNAPSDRHPDHGNAASLVKDAAWLSGLEKLETFDENQNPQKAYRTEKIYNFIQYKLFKPDFVVDIRGYLTQKMEAVMAYKSQFYDPNSHESNTLISSPEFLEQTNSRNYIMGNYGMIMEAEGFLSQFTPAVDSLFHLL